MLREMYWPMQCVKCSASIAFFTVNPFSITRKAVCRFVTRIKRLVITVYMYDTAIFIVLPVLSGCPGTILNVGWSTLFSNSNVHTFNPVQLCGIHISDPSIITELCHFALHCHEIAVSEHIFLRYNLTMKRDKLDWLLYITLTIIKIILKSI